MEKRFKLSQLFSVVDGRLSTDIADVYEMLNHITGTSLMTHQLPTALDYIKIKNPPWFKRVQTILFLLGATKFVNFEKCLSLIKENDEWIDIPQLADEFDISDFHKYMADNDLFLPRK